jgi:hypothetical protein
VTEPSGVKKEIPESHPSKLQQLVHPGQEPEVAKAEEVEDLRSQRRERKSLPFEEKSLRERKLKIETEKGGETHQAKRSAQKEGERRSVDTKGHLNLTIPLCIGGIKEIGVHVNLSSLPPDRQRRGWQGALPRSDHPRWASSENKAQVKRAKQELYNRRNYK